MASTEIFANIVIQKRVTSESTGKPPAALPIMAFVLWHTRCIMP